MKECISVTDQAKKILIEKMTENELNVKLSVTSSGCSGNSYKMEFVKKEEIKKFDEIIQLDSSHNLIVDSASIIKIIGTELYWINDGINSKFEFRNPQAENFCGCGESFSVKTA